MTHVCEQPVPLGYVVVSHGWAGATPRALSAIYADYDHAEQWAIIADQTERPLNIQILALVPADGGIA